MVGVAAIPSGGFSRHSLETSMLHTSTLRTECSVRPRTSLPSLPLAATLGVGPSTCTFITQRSTRQRTRGGNALTASFHGASKTSPNSRTCSRSERLPGCASRADASKWAGATAASSSTLAVRNNGGRCNSVIPDQVSLWSRKGVLGAKLPGFLSKHGVSNFFADC